MRVAEPEFGDLIVLDGVAVFVRAVEIGEQIAVRLCARRNARTDALDAAYDAAFEAWASVAVDSKAKGLRPPDPPRQPGAVLGELSVQIFDDVDTAYRWVGTEAAGTGTEWDAAWRFEPLPPPLARLLRVVAGDEQPGCAVQL
jgi:hypothetical protein